jgi:hypothetical protein
MLSQAAQRLPAGVKVVLLADRGFVHLKAMKLITTTFGWHYRIRIKRNTWVWRSRKGWRQLKDIHQFALSVRSPDFALSWRLPPSISLPKGLMLSHRTSAAALTPIGFAVTATFALAGTGSKLPCCKAGN